MQTSFWGVCSQSQGGSPGPPIHPSPTDRLLSIVRDLSGQPVCLYHVTYCPSWTPEAPEMVHCVVLKSQVPPVDPVQIQSFRYYRRTYEIAVYVLCVCVCVFERPPPPLNDCRKRADASMQVHTRHGSCVSCCANPGWTIPSPKKDVLLPCTAISCEMPSTASGVLNMVDLDLWDGLEDIVDLAFWHNGHRLPFHGAPWSNLQIVQGRCVLVCI